MDTAPRSRPERPADMIQFFCPGCGRRMDLEDFRAGQVGRCLQCRCKFRVPKQAEPSDNPDAAPTPTISRHPALDRQLSALASKRKQSRPPANVPSKPARRAEADEVEEERRPRRRPPKPEPEPVEEDDVVEEVEVTQEVEAESGDQEDTASSSERRRKRKRHKKGSLPTSGLLVGAGVAVLVWIALVAVGFFYQPATYALLILGSITTFAGRRMFLQVAREEGMGPWLSCLFIPFYSTYFFFNRIRQTLVPFLIGCVGYLLLASGGVLWLIHFVWHGDSLHAPGAGRPEHPTAGLVFNVAGQSAHVPIDEMSYHRVKRGRGSSRTALNSAVRGPASTGPFRRALMRTGASSSASR